MTQNFRKVILNQVINFSLNDAGGSAKNLTTDNLLFDILKVIVLVLDVG